MLHQTKNKYLHVLYSENIQQLCTDDNLASEGDFSQKTQTSGNRRQILEKNSSKIYLRKRAQRGHDPGDGQHQLGPLATGDVVDGEHDGRETVKRDHNHDEARGIESNHSKHTLKSQYYFQKV